MRLKRHTHTHTHTYIQLSAFVERDEAEEARLVAEKERSEAGKPDV